MDRWSLAALLSLGPLGCSAPPACPEWPAVDPDPPFDTCPAGEPEAVASCVAKTSGMLAGGACEVRSVPIAGGYRVCAATNAVDCGSPETRTVVAEVCAEVDLERRSVRTSNVRHAPIDCEDLLRSR